MQLRGGGCTGSKNQNQGQKYNLRRNQQKVSDIVNDNNERSKLARYIKLHTDTIINYAVIAASEKDKLMNSFQFFNDNERELWQVVMSKEQTSEIFDIVKKQLKPLMEALETLIKGYVNYSVYVAQIISQLSWIIFSFYTIKNPGGEETGRYMEVKEQAEYLKAVTKIEEQMKIEKNIDKYLNNLEYELFIIDSILTICPTNSKELQEVMELFVSGVVKSFFTFSISTDLLESLMRGALYLYGEQNKASCKKKLSIILTLFNVKFTVIKQIESISQKVQEHNEHYLEKLNNIYKNVISKSQDWQIWCTWIKIISSLFQQKLILPCSIVEKYCKEEQTFLLTLPDKKFWLNIDCKLIENNPTAKLLFQNIEQLQEQAKLQYAILQGYDDMPSFEQLYFKQLTLVAKKQDSKEYEYALTSISVMLHNTENIRKSQEKMSQLINVLNPNNTKAIKEIETNLQIAISSTVALLEEILIFEKLKLHLFQERQQSELKSPEQPQKSSQPTQMKGEEQNQIKQQQSQQLKQKTNNQLQIPESQQSQKLQLVIQKSPGLKNQKIPQPQQIDNGQQQPKSSNTKTKWFRPHIKIKRRFCQSFIQFYLNKFKNTNSAIIYDIANEFIIKQYEKKEIQPQQINMMVSNQNLINNSNQNLQDGAPSPNLSSRNESPVQNIQRFINFDQNDAVNEEEDSNEQKFDVIKELYLLDNYKTHPKPKKNKEKKPNIDYLKVVKEFSLEPNNQDKIVNLQANLKSIRLLKSKHTMESDEDYKQALKESFEQLNFAFSFLKWNLRLYLTMKFQIQQLSSLSDQQAMNSILNHLKALSQQLAELKPVSRTIKYFYEIFDACLKLKIFKNIPQQSNIQKILFNITVRKFLTANILAKIYKEILQKSIENFHFSIAQQLFFEIQEDIEKIGDHISHLQSGFTMAKSLIEQEKLKHHDGNDGFNDLQRINIFEQEFWVPANQQEKLQNKKIHQEIENYYKRFVKQVSQLENKLKNQENLKQALDNKDQAIKKLLKLLEMISQYQVISEDDTQIFEMLHDDANRQMKAITEIILDLPQADQNMEQQLNDGETLFKDLYSKIEEIESILKTQLKNAKFINDENGFFATLLNNYQMLESLSSESQIYQEKIQKTKKQLSDLLTSYENTLPIKLLDCKQIQNVLSSYLYKFPKDLESSVYFILTQIGKQTEIQQETGYYDQFKEVAEDYFTNQIWRIRQFCIFELIQLRGSCLTNNSVTLSTGLYIKFQIYETDNRNKLLLGDHDADSFNQIVHQYWPAQEEEVQNKIKIKLEELNDIAYKITIEISQHEKAKLKKQYLRLEQEIQVIIKNAEGLGNSIGTSLLFFQDLKQDLVTIQSQLKTLQSSIDQISKDVQYLRGRCYKDLLEMRMQRILQTRLIINSESVYIQIKTREKKIGAEIEDEETPLFTEDIFSNGEINEFIWQEQKISLLIQGKAGSGKSTAARKIEEFLWLLYQKNKDIQGAIPIIPIFVPLPQLRDPLYSVMEETLRSDNYRFSDKQILEFKEAVEQNELKLVIIMDSYDEIKPQFIGVNLNQTNKIFKWRAPSDEMKFPKIITTSRSEIFNSGGYNSWFLSESDDLSLYKEIRLLNFSSDQVKLYIEQYCILCVKKVIKEFYFSQKDNQGFFAFQELFNDIFKIIAESQIDRLNKLSVEQIQKIISRCQAFVTGDIALAMREMLEEIWSENKYYDFINKMEIDSLLETPFMVEIVVTVLPQMAKHRQEIGFLKEQFLNRYKHLKKIEQDGQKAVLDLWQKIVNNEGFINNFIQEFSQIQQIQQIEIYFNKFQDYEMIKRSLLIEPLCAYDFYMQFFEQYFKRQINKLKETGEAIDYTSIGGELWEFAHKLANDMTIQNLSLVKFKPSGLIFKKKESDWTDIYFNDDCENGAIKKMFRSIIPIKQKFGVYSFNHKSLQEFLVSKWFIELLQGFSEEPAQYLAKNIHLFDESFFCISWDQDFMKGSVKFVADKLKNNEEAIEKLKSILYLSSSSKNKFQEMNFDNEKLQMKICRGSSNCLYLLHQMGVSFESQNFKGLWIKDINLSGANFFNSNLSDSKFENVKISKVNFNFANLSNIDWTQIQIDELPYIKTQFKKINFITYLMMNEQKLLFVKGQGKNETQFLFHDIFSADKNKKFDLSLPFIPTLIIQSPQNHKYCQTVLINKTDIALSPDNLMEWHKKKIILQEEKIQYDKVQVLQQDKKKQNWSADFLFGGFLQEEFLLLTQDQALYQIPLTKINEQGENCQFDEYVVMIFGTNIRGLKMTDHNKIFILLEQSCQYFIFDSEKKELIKQPPILHLQQANIFDVSFSSNYLAVADTQTNNQYLLTLFNLKKADEKPIMFPTFGQDFTYLQFVQEEKYLFTVSHSVVKSNETYLRLWHVREHIQIQQILILDNVVSVSYIPDPFLIITALEAFKIQIWDLQSSLNQNLAKESTKITCCLFTTSGNQLISGNNQGLIQIWDTKTGKRFGRNLKNHKKNITSFAIVWEKDQELLGSASLDGYVSVWSLQMQKLLYSVHVINPVQTLDFINNNNQYQIVTLCEKESYLQIWEKENRQSYLLIGENTFDNSQNIKISLENTKAAIEEFQTNNFDLLTDNAFFKMKSKQNQVKITAMLINEHFQYLILATNEGKICLVKENEPSSTVNFEKSDVNDGQYILLRETTKDGFIAATTTKIKMFQIKQQNQLDIIEQKMDFSTIIFNEITYIYCNLESMFVCYGQIQQYSLITGKQLIMKNVSNISSHGISCLLQYHEKNKLLLGYQSGILKVFDLLTTTFSDDCQAHQQGIRTIEILKMNKKVLTASEKGEIKIWSLTSSDSNLMCLNTIETGFQITQLWILDAEDTVVIQSDTSIQITMLYQNYKYQVAEISKNQQVALCLKSQYIYYTEDNEVQKQAILQQKQKEIFIMNSKYKPKIMIMGRTEIITSDDFSNIYFWDYQGQIIYKFENRNLCDFINEQKRFQKFTLRISDKKDSLLLFYQDDNYGLIKFSIQRDPTTNNYKLIPEQHFELPDENLLLPNDARFLNEENILITQLSRSAEAFVFSTNTKDFIQGFHDHENYIEGQAIFQDKHFVTYGEDNQISFYEKVGDKYAEKFIMSETIQKFNIKYSERVNSKVISMQGINLETLFQQKDTKL